MVAKVDQASIACEELDKSIKEEATQVAALEWEQRAHKNAVKTRKQKIVSLRALDAKDLAQTTSERKAVSAWWSLRRASSRAELILLLPWAVRCA